MGANKKTKIIFTAAAFVLVLSAVCVILFANNAGDKVNSSEEEYPGHFVVDSELTLNDGKFYLNGNTDSCYFDIQNGAGHLVFTEENYKDNYAGWSESDIKKSYEWALDYWKEPRPYNVWRLHLRDEPDELFLSFEMADIELGDEIVSAPGGGYFYIDENSFCLSDGAVYTRV